MICMEMATLECDDSAGKVGRQALRLDYIAENLFRSYSTSLLSPLLIFAGLYLALELCEPPRYSSSSRLRCYSEMKKT